VSDPGPSGPSCLFFELLVFKFKLTLTYVCRRVALTSFDLQIFQERRIADTITNYNIHVGTKISTLKENQKSAVKYLVEGKDCIPSHLLWQITDMLVTAFP